MNPENVAKMHESEFLLRRFADPMPDWAILLPVGFALGVALLITLFRHEHKLRTLLISSGVVLGLSLPYLLAAFLLRKLTIWPVLSWWVVLLPFLAVALLYVFLMYLRDSKSIHPLWAIFLGLCRCTVYFVLAAVFLLPGCQDYETRETYSRVLVLLDVSGSMVNHSDDLPGPGQDAAGLPTRRDKVVQFLTKEYGPENGKLKTFLSHLTEKTPVMVYRFGSQPDLLGEFVDDKRKDLTKEELADFTKPNKDKIKYPADMHEDDRKKYKEERERVIESLPNGTDVSGSALQVVQREIAANRLQAIIVISDGQSNKGSEDAIRELQLIAGNPKRPLHIFTVGVGDYREPVRIRLQPLRAPATVRPDDGGFPVRVPVFGDGLKDEEFQATLLAQRVKDKNGKDLNDSKVMVVGTKKAKFGGEGEYPYAEVEFIVNFEELLKMRAKDDAEGIMLGTWHFSVEVPRHPKETNSPPKHVSERPTPVRVQKDKLRVLLVASGPNREYQFIRTMLFREVLEDRMDLSVFLQTASESEDIDQDVKSQRLLTRFPNRLGPPRDDDRFLNLKGYDVIIAYDVNWTALDAEALLMIKEWVGDHAGGLIFVAGGINTDRLARPGGADVGKKLDPLLTILPVKLSDSVLEGLEGKKNRDRTQPFALHFSGNSRSYDFLKLDEDKPEVPLSGWDDFFWKGKPPVNKPNAIPDRGFYSYQPVEKIRPTTEVIATIADPDVPRINEGNDEQPFMATIPFDKGRTFYLGSGEMWRLRQFKEAYFERFWVKLVRFVAATGQTKRIGRFAMAPEYVSGIIPVEGEFLDKDELPVRAEIKLEVQIKRPFGFDPKLDTITPDKVTLLAKKSGEKWRGTFAGSFPARTPGTYELSIDTSGTGDPVVHRFEVKEPNLEMGNLKTNFPSLYNMATDAAPVLEHLDADTREKVLLALERPKGVDAKEAKGTTRLFLPLRSAGLITDCIQPVRPDRESVKGKFMDLWDRGTEAGLKMYADNVIMLAALIIGAFTCIILAVIRRWILLGVVAGLSVTVIVAVLIANVVAAPNWLLLPVEMSWVLGFIVGLLALEWLTRKLLKLA